MRSSKSTRLVTEFFMAERLFMPNGLEKARPEVPWSSVYGWQSSKFNAFLSSVVMAWKKPRTIKYAESA